VRALGEHEIVVLRIVVPRAQPLCDPGVPGLLELAQQAPRDPLAQDEIPVLVEEPDLLLG